MWKTYVALLIVFSFMAPTLFGSSSALSVDTIASPATQMNEYEVEFQRKQELWRAQRRELDENMGRLEREYGAQLSDVDRFALHCLRRRAVFNYSIYFDEWKGFVAAVEACASAEDVRTLLYPSGNAGFQGITRQFSVRKQREDILPIVEEALNVSGCSDLPYRVFLPECGAGIGGNGGIEHIIPCWVIYVGDENYDKAEGTLVELSIATDGKLWKITSKENPFEWTQEIELTEDESRFATENAIHFLREYVSTPDISCEIIRNSRYAHTGSANERLTWVWIYCQTLATEAYFENDERPYVNPGYLFAVGLDSGNVYYLTIIAEGYIPTI